MIIEGMRMNHNKRNDRMRIIQAKKRSIARLKLTPPLLSRVNFFRQDNITIVLLRISGCQAIARHTRPREEKKSNGLRTMQGKKRERVHRQTHRKQV
jgi:hypothetical protein